MELCADVVCDVLID